MRISAPKRGGSFLDSIFPGYEKKLWAATPDNIKKLIIQRQHSQFEGDLNKIAAEEKISTLFHENVSKALKPNQSVYPVVDYRRQFARGTFIGGNATGVLRNRTVATDAASVYEPFTAAEQAVRNQHRTFSTGAFVATVAALAAYFEMKQRDEPYGVHCLEYDPPHAPHYPFWMKSMFHSHDVRSIRRGYEVYRQVCATCHSMKFVAFRHLNFNDVYPETFVKKHAASFDVVDGPNEQGEMFERPGIPLDYFPSPYPNEEAARFANGGATPPDLSVYAGAKHGGIDYIMALLTSYREAPAGVELRSGLYYNSVFPGGTIAMPPPLLDEMIEYEDGTPATVSQMAKDVASFMAWAMDPNHDARKLIMLKASSGMALATGLFGYTYRWHWASLRTRSIRFPKMPF